MKKLAFIILGTMIAGSAAVAQTNVLSRNAVGYIKKEIASNKFDMVSVPFVNLDGGDNTLSNVFESAAANTQVSFWDRSTAKYRTLVKGAKSGWSTGGTNVIPRGEGIFVRSPSDQTFYFMGEVPDQYTAPTSKVQIAEGVNAVSLAYPVAQSWTSTTAAAALPANTQVSIWNGSNYQTIVKGAKSGWGTNDILIQPGQAVIIYKPTAGNYEWDQGKPYSWP